MYQFGYGSKLRFIFLAISISALGSVVPAMSQVVATTNSETSAPVVPAEQNFATALEALLTGADSDTASFYAGRDYQPVWSGDAKNILALITAIEQAPDHGMTVSRYNLANLELLWAAGDAPEQLAALEIQAAQSFVKFAKELKAGILDPRNVPNPNLEEDDDVEMYATRYVPKTSELLTNVASATDMSAFYQSLQPSAPEYAQMLKLKQELEALISSNGWGAVVPKGETLRLGNSGTRVVALRKRLEHRGYDVNDLSSTSYDEALLEIVKIFQNDYGVNADGVVGPQTLASINAQPDGRLKQVIVNLERMRWMNYDLGDRHVYVNIPDFRASIIDSDEPILSFRVVVGKGDFQTTEFSDVMTHLIINPSWNVPFSIASEEYLPKLRTDPTVLLRENISMMVRGTEQVVDATMLDYSYFTEENFPFFLKQLPGADNALGRVKFMFPNRFNIYMHDTPAKSLFAKDARAFSHGCVRVHKPLEFAYALLSLQADDPETLFSTALATGEETQINLAKPVPVHIVYRTAWVDLDGESQFRHDVYGRDALVLNALIGAGVTLLAM